jgi:hypothetical protein
MAIEVNPSIPALAIFADLGQCILETKDAFLTLSSSAI